MQESSSSKLLSLIATCLIVLSASALAGDPPPLLNYQGWASDASGEPLDGDYEITFTIYNGAIGGNQLWTETQSLSITNGLFNVLLGSVNPLPESVFDGGNAYLGIAVESDPEMTPRQRLVTAAYAHRVSTVDGANGGAIVGDVDVAGSIAAGDSVLAYNFRAGTPSSEGKFWLFDDGSSNPVAEIKPHLTQGGGELRLFDPSNGQSVYASHDASQGSGGFLTITRNAASAPGFHVDGNYAGTNSPRVLILDDNTTMVFDTGAEGDSAVMLPFSTISSIETANEPGVSEAVETDDLTLDDIFTTPQTLVAQSINCPKSGYVLAIGTAHLYFNNSDGFWGDVDFGLSTFTSTIEFGYKYTVRHHSASSSGQEERIITVHRVFDVDEGEQTVNFLAKTEGILEPIILNAQISLVYFPTWYGPRTPGAQLSAGDIDELVDNRVQEETARLQEQFERRLQELESALKEQHAGGN